MSSVHQGSLRRRSPAGLAIVAGLHVVFIYALANGISFTPQPQKEQRTVAEVLPDDSVPPPGEPVPTSDPNIISRYDDPLPVPDFKFETPPDTTPITLPTPANAGPSGSGELRPTIRGARVDPRHPLTQPPYPPIEIRAGHEGALTLALLVRVDGSVADARVIKSSGFPLLDLAAVNEAKRRWRLLPASHDGSAMEDWTTLRVVFRLDGQQR